MRHSIPKKKYCYWSHLLDSYSYTVKNFGVKVYQEHFTRPCNFKFFDPGDEKNEAEEEMETTPTTKTKVLPIVVDIATINLDYTKTLIKKVKEIMPETTMKYTPKQLTFYTKSVNNYQTIIEHLNKNKICYHTCSRKEDLDKKFVIKGLPPIDIEELTTSTTDQGVIPKKLAKMKRQKKPSDPTEESFATYYLAIMRTIMNKNNLSFNLKIAHWNANGLTHKWSELKNFINHNNIDLMLINEIRASPKYQFKLSGCTSHRLDRPGQNAGGGLLILVKSNIKHSPLNLNYNFSTLEAIGVKIENSLAVISVYARPTLNNKKQLTN
ncbi:Similar to pol: RNA-directed DNA polymerase from mobile element jockey (Drosophila melanogaster) [Cotesia congregata]|uniref:Similar to pol: RNA-directed DNA polymerase from mobile element jockey (Drosophila melanogaster) n=1 Tax=Cotesia congregata TaxID=51543 RepID=A0A8J2H813_COTCN|nr:Similar to pol: RNA-directed DNA polymerase from mobile element jockey (Drosophila melanogaster) [Cotesia congregata]